VELPSGTAIREAVVALVQQAGSRLGQTPEFCTALQQQLASGSRGAGELLRALTSTPAGWQLVAGQPGILAAAAEAASAFVRAYTQPPPPEPRCQPAYIWGEALVALVTGGDCRAVVLGQEPQLLVTIQALLLLQLPELGTPQQDQQQAWALVVQALECQELLDSWGSSTLPAPLERRSLTSAVAVATRFTTCEEGLAAAAAALKVLLGGLPLAAMVQEVLTSAAVPAHLLYLQGRLEALGDTSLMEGVVAMVQRLDPVAGIGAAVVHAEWQQLFLAACQLQPDLVVGLLQRLREEDLPAAAAAYPTWQGLFEAAAQLQPGVAGTVESLRNASGSIASLLAGVQLGHETCVKRLADLLSEGADSPSRQQLMGCRELPGAIAAAMCAMPARLTPPQQRWLVSGLVQGPLGRELLLSSLQLQQAVAADVRQYPGNGSVFIRFGMGTDVPTRDAHWANVLEVRHRVLAGCMQWVLCAVACHRHWVQVRGVCE
jgi:hypothetical protein